MPEVALKQKEVQRKLEAERWKMPEPMSGMVAWRAQLGQGDTSPGLIVRRTRDTIDVMVFHAAGNFRWYEGARHVTDPSLKGRTEPNPGGVFELTEFEQRVSKFMREFHD